MAVGPDEALRCFDLLRWLQGKWVPDIVIGLWDGPKRFTDLLVEIHEQNIEHRWSAGDGSLSRQAYTQTLHRLEAEDVILRYEDQSTIPKSVFYELSPLIRDLLEHHMHEPIVWAGKHEDVIDRARRRRQEPEHSSSESP